MPHPLHDQEDAASHASLQVLTDPAPASRWRSWGVTAAAGTSLVALSLLIVQTQPQTAAGRPAASHTPTDTAARPEQPQQPNRSVATTDAVSHFLAVALPPLPQTHRADLPAQRFAVAPAALESAPVPTNVASANPVPRVVLSSPSITPDLPRDVAVTPAAPAPVEASSQAFAAPVLPAAPAASPAPPRWIAGPFELSIQADEDVIFLIDASGSMIDRMPGVLEQVAAAVNRLGPDQRFNVLAFASGDVQSVFENPVRATAEAKAVARDWLHPRDTPVQPAGRTTLLPAVRFALSQKPDHVVLIADAATAAPREGEESAQAMLAQIGFGPAGAIRISTVELADDFTTQTSQSLLARIATQHQGQHHRVEPDFRHRVTRHPGVLDLR